MAINFTKNIEQYTTTQKVVRSKNFTEYTSKKQLENAEILSASELEFVKSIKGTFSFAIHQAHRYLAITLYKANADKKYSFLVVDLKERAIAEVGSIKQAKAEIMELVSAVETEDPISQEDVVEEAKPAAEEQYEPEQKRSRNRGRKNSNENEAQTA